MKSISIILIVVACFLFTATLPTFAQNTGKISNRENSTKVLQNVQEQKSATSCGIRLKIQNLRVKIAFQTKLEFLWAKIKYFFIRYFGFGKAMSWEDYRSLKESMKNDKLAYGNRDGYSSPGGSGYNSRGGSGYSSPGGSEYRSSGGSGYSSSGGSGYSSPGGSGYNSPGGSGYAVSERNEYSSSGGNYSMPMGREYRSRTMSEYNSPDGSPMGNAYNGIDGSEQGENAPLPAGGGPEESQPLPVTLVSFTAVRHNGYVSIEWTTACEINILGVNIYRGETQLNKSLIPACGDPIIGRTYKFIDKQGVPDAHYELEVIDRSGKTQLLESVQAKIL